jgi:ADP-heptose:LPS heptosyltransferase
MILEQKKYERIVFVIRLSAIGDVIIASHAILKLIQNNYYPILVTSSLTKEIAERILNLNDYICLENKKNLTYFINKKETNKAEFEKHLKKINTHKNNILLDLQKTLRSKKALKLINKKLNLKIEQKYSVSKRTFYRTFLIMIRYLYFKQKKIKTKITIKRIHDLQEETIVRIIKDDKKIYFKTENKSILTLIKKDSLLSKKINYICFFPGASGFIKTWPKEKFRELADILLQKTNLNIVICGLSENEEFIGNYISYLKQDRIINLVNKTSLSQTLDIISQAKYIVTNDSFAAHAADAYQIPATVIFGATSPHFGFVPLFKNILIEYENLACSPCSRHGKGHCRYQNLKCLQLIESKKVFKNITDHYQT